MKRAAARPAGALLRALCRYEPPLRSELEPWLADGLDWQLFGELARNNRVLSLAWSRLGRLAPDAVPAEHARHFADWRARMSLHALTLTGELVNLVEACERAGIEALPYKGPALSQLFYEDLGQRNYRDADLLVRANDVHAATAILLDHGWRPRDGSSARPGRQELREDCELHFEREPELELELHWQLLPRRHARNLDAEQLWQRTVPLRLAGAGVRTFSAEDWLVLLCLHGGDKHRWSRLQMVTDVAWLIGRRPDLDWKQAFATALGIERETSLQLGLLLAWFLLDAPLPDQVLERVSRSPRRRGRAALLADRPFEVDARLPTFASWRAAMASQAERLREARIDTAPCDAFARYLQAALEPDWGDRQALDLPQGLSFLYWILRPVRMLARHGTGLVRRMGLSTE